MLYIGNHTSSSRGYLAMGKQMLANGGNTFAFFTRNPRGGKAKDIDPQDVQAFLQLADQALLKGDKDSLMPYLQSASGTYCTDVPMNAGQELRVELALDWEQKTYQVLSWKVYHQEDYEIDQSIPVWSGN